MLPLRLSSNISILLCFLIHPVYMSSRPSKNLTIQSLSTVVCGWISNWQSRRFSNPSKKSFRNSALVYSNIFYVPMVLLLSLVRYTAFQSAPITCCTISTMPRILKRGFSQRIGVEYAGGFPNDWKVSSRRRA
jgi:hypothetical protein